MFGMKVLGLNDKKKAAEITSKFILAQKCYP